MNEQDSYLPEDEGGLKLLQTDDIKELLEWKRFSINTLRLKSIKIGRFYAHRIEAAAKYCDSMAFFRVKESILDKLCSLFEDGFQEGQPFVSLQEKMGISNDSLFAVYLHIQDVFDEKEYGTRVENILLLLIYLNPFVPSFWHALGVYYQKQKLWKQACNYYFISLALSQDYTLSFFPFVGCLEQLNKREEAKHLLKEFVEDNKSNPALSDWVAKAKQIMKTL